MRALMCVAAALGVAACVGDAAELGGITNRMAPTAQVRACDLDELRVTTQGQLRFPEDAMMFVYMTQQDFSLAQAKIRYDINQAGVPVNISYAGPAADTRHATRQKVIRSAADAVQETRYEWKGAPAFATGCVFDLTVEIRNLRDPASS